MQASRETTFTMVVNQVEWDTIMEAMWYIRSNVDHGVRLNAGDKQTATQLYKQMNEVDPDVE